MERSLKRKVRYFLESRYRGRAEVHGILAEMRRIGTVVIIGGLLRDLMLLSKAERFRSDVDIVVDTSNPMLFNDYMSSRNAKLNRFGGYRIEGQYWTVDAWLLENTWAHQMGHVHIGSCRDLVHTTFFNCDAIIYDVASKEVCAKQGYFDELSRRFLEINLRPNPNPVGSAVRALRLSVENQFSWGPSLSMFINELLENTNWESLVSYEQNSYNTQTIGYFFRKPFREKLRRYVRFKRSGGFVPFEKGNVKQLELSLSD